MVTFASEYIIHEKFVKILYLKGCDKQYFSNSFRTKNILYWNLERVEEIDLPTLLDVYFFGFIVLFETILLIYEQNSVAT